MTRGPRPDGLALLLGRRRASAEGGVRGGVAEDAGAVHLGAADTGAGEQLAPAVGAVAGGDVDVVNTSNRYALIAVAVLVAVGLGTVVWFYIDFPRIIDARLHGERDAAGHRQRVREIVVGIVVKPAQLYCPNGVPVLRSTNVRESGVDLSDIVFMSEKSNQAHAKSILKAGDVVTVRTGAPGTTCVIPESLNGCNCVDIIISRPSDKVLPAFLALWINSPFGREQVSRVQAGLAQQHFNVGELQRLLVGLPKRPEQLQILDVMRQHVENVEAIQHEHRKLCELKHGLAHDLLSGRVRVPLTSVVDDKATGG